MRCITRSPLACALLLLAGAALVPAAPARANGNVSHSYATLWAVDHLPAGELRDLLSREELRNVLRNGCMFPDGGYAVGDDYGELSHWEPFHLVYLEWIRTNYAPPWSNEAARHIALLMGMAAHGQSDQLYDGAYLQRMAHYDENGDDATYLGIDGATDVCFAATQEEIAAPEVWVPAEVLAPLYAQLGHQVAPATIEEGQGMVAYAITVVIGMARNPEQVAQFHELYPWGCGHQDDPAAPGSVPTHAPVIARYWQVLWARLHGDAEFRGPLTGTLFTGGTPFEQPADAGTPDSWVHFVMPFGLDPPTINGDTVEVTRDDGSVHPVNLHVYYGNNSHMVNVKPQEDWPAETDVTVTISPPIASWDDIGLTETLGFEFSTRDQPPAEPEPEPDAEAEADAAAEPEVAVEREPAESAEEPGEPDLQSGDEDRPSGGGGSGCAWQAPGSGAAVGVLGLVALLFLAGRRRSS